MNYTLLTLLSLSLLMACQAQTDKATNTTSPLGDKAQLETKVDALVKQYQDLDIFSGVVLIAEAGDPVYHKAFGLANRELGTPNTINTKFDIGSMNKTFTKTVVLQLLEEGKLKLSDPLGQYLEGFPAEAAQKITIEHLLNHSSGYGDYFSPAYFDNPPEDIAGNVAIIRELPLMFEPGTEQEYSNAGYMLLGAIIEKVTNKTYYRNMEERILTPLALTETYLINKREVPQRATGYYKSMKGEIEDNNKFRDMPMPDGGFQATASDIMKFYREFHYGEKLVKKSTKMSDAYFQAIQEHTTSGGAIPHAGGFEGANTVNFEILRDKITIVVFANMDEPVAEQLGAGILAIIRGQEPQAPALPAVQMVYQAYTKHGVDYVKQHFEDLITNFHPTDPKDLILNNIGYNLLFNNEVKEAIEIFTLNTQLFPESANVWDSLGEAYLNNGERQKALEAYEKALSIDPNMPTAQDAVRQLRG